MCGIAGILTREPAPFAEALQVLQSALRHRGPDDEGLWLSPGRRAGLVHTRLSILDLSAAGHQPMLSPDGRLAIVFNGEIYNFRELREQMESAGESFETQSDTEVLLRLYAREGAAMVQKLRGMFAFAIWDEAAQAAFMARDPLGIKPLYYTLRDGRLAFASELRVLQAAGMAGDALDPAAVMRFFESGSVAEPRTLLKDVRCLPAGHHLVWHDGKAREELYWKPVFAPTAMTADEAARVTRNGLLDSLEHHFVSDVPVGLFLSGGIDSTLLAALSRELGRTGLESFSIGVDDAGLDESTVAARTAGHFGMRHHEMRMDAAKMAEGFPRFLARMDQPSVDGFNTFTVAGFAHECGMKVVLSGLGGDEMFGGYPSFQKVPQLAQLAALARLVPGSPMVGQWMERHLPRLPLRRVGSLLQREPTLLNACRTFRGIFTRREARLLAARYTGCDESQVPEPQDASALDGDPLDQVSILEICLYMRNQLLKDSDVMSMAHGLELRVPLVDRVLFETVARIPAALRLRQGKQLLLEAVPEIPRWVAGQPKRGFSFPYEKWLAADWGRAFDRARAELPDQRATWYQLWCVFMMQRWLERRS